MLNSRSNMQRALLCGCICLSLTISVSWYLLSPDLAAKQTYPTDTDRGVSSSLDDEAINWNFTTSENRKIVTHGDSSLSRFEASTRTIFTQDDEADEGQSAARSDSQQVNNNVETKERRIASPDKTSDVVDGRGKEKKESLQWRRKRGRQESTETGANWRRSYHERTCSLERRRTMPIPKEGTYQTVVNDVTWVMSAHVDHRRTDVFLVRVFGLSSEMSVSEEPNTELYCQMWNSTGHLIATAAANMALLHPVGFRIESFQMECIFRVSLHQPQNKVLSVTAGPCDEPTNNLIIYDNGQRPAVDYAVCISGPTKYNYSDYQRLIEWMELNAIFGVGRTVIYNVEVSQLIHRIFDYYKRRGVLDVYYVNPPYVHGDERWMTQKGEDPGYAKMSMRHDCLMREMFKTKYVAFLDLDENIVPRMPTDYTWDDMITSSDCGDSSVIAACKVFFPTDRGVDYMAKRDPLISDTYRLLSLTTTVRGETVFPAQRRSKYLAKPELLAIASTHRAYMLNDRPACILTAESGALHHYKAVNTNEQTYTRDRTMYKYKSLLLKSVSRAYSDLRHEFESFDIFV